jgi:hypothetical protein
MCESGDTTAAWSKARNVLARSNTGIVGSNPTHGMDVCLRLLCICLQVAALRRADHSSKVTYGLSKIKKLKHLTDVLYSKWEQQELR